MPQQTHALLSAPRLVRLLAGPGLAIVLCALSASAVHGAAPDTSLAGDWITPDQSALRVAPCGGDLCIRITRLPPNNPYSTDGLNPDTQLRTRPLCGLEIGRGFHTSSPDRAEDGSLYDPKSGKTYRGSMMVEGDQLHLRGYIGLKLFGRTETWTRSKAPIQVCTKAG